MFPSSKFDVSWPVIGQTVIATLLAYLGITLLLRISGKRTLTRMTAADMIVPFTLGPIMASAILVPQVSFYAGYTAFTIIVLLHILVSWLSDRSRFFQRLVRPEPTLVYHEGRKLQDAMRRERVSDSDLHEAARASGYAALDQVQSIILEADGVFNVIERQGQSKSRSGGKPQKSST